LQTHALIHKHDEFAYSWLVYRKFLALKQVAHRLKTNLESINLKKLMVKFLFDLRKVFKIYLTCSFFEKENTTYR